MPKPIIDLEAWSIIIYIGYEDGYVSDHIKELDKKFKILAEYQKRCKSEKTIETVIKTKNYILYGFIIKKNKDDNICYKRFDECLVQVQKYNRKHLYEYVGFEYFEDENDPCVMDKLINLLRNTLSHVEIYICYPKQYELRCPMEGY